MWVVIVRNDSHRDSDQVILDAQDPDATGPFETREAAEAWIKGQPAHAGWFSFRYEAIPLCAP